MKKICNFKINNRIYTIFNVDRIYGKSTYVGQTDYNTKHIYIENNSYQEKIITLKHELIHVWLYENGYKYQGSDLCFSVEDICEIAAYSNSFINLVISKYIRNGG